MRDRNTTTVAELEAIIQARAEHIRRQIEAEHSVSHRFYLAGRVLNLENCLALIDTALKGYGDESD
ncbi:MAG: hypothetical protein GWN58_27865 [Anaerolineae bacterium]|nr:hypothetical protein [Anaerolineae bacterium]